MTPQRDTRTTIIYIYYQANLMARVHGTTDADAWCTAISAVRELARTNKVRVRPVPKPGTYDTYRCGDFWAVARTLTP